MQNKTYHLVQNKSSPKLILRSDYQLPEHVTTLNVALAEKLGRRQLFQIETITRGAVRAVTTCKGKLT